MARRLLAIGALAVALVAGSWSATAAAEGRLNPTVKKRAISSILRDPMLVNLNLAMTPRQALRCVTFRRTTPSDTAAQRYSSRTWFVRIRDDSPNDPVCARLPFGDFGYYVFNRNDAWYWVPSWRPNAREHRF